MNRNSFWPKMQTLIKTKVLQKSLRKRVNSPFKTGPVLSSTEVFPSYWNSTLMQQVEATLEGPKWTFVSTGVSEKVQTCCSLLLFPCCIVLLLHWPFCYVNVSELESKADNNKVLWGQRFRIAQKTKPFFKERVFQYSPQ